MWTAFKFALWLFWDDIKEDLRAIWKKIRPMRNR